MGKIKTKEEIGKIADELREEGKKIVTCNGAFDLIHIGHIKFLQKAKAQGDVLIVGLNSDKSIKKYKSKDRPLIQQEFRAETLEALECVDYITIFDETVPMSFIENIKPAVHVNGYDYGKDCIEKPIVEKYGGKIHIPSNYKGISTTKLIERIMKVYGK
ncbi:adenylyltransferase/cytidyltransferase family protein [Candidatus Woesearchaeota archaeon]|nr:adenylyltransferase/cytidyltransferase family protein [Candidatus Woesearchaeota archaeon]